MAHGMEEPDTFIHATNNAKVRFYLNMGMILTLLRGIMI